MSHYLELLEESDRLLKWLADKGRNVKITQDQLEEFTQPFKYSSADLTTHLFRWGHVESFYGNRIALTRQGLEFAKKTSYANEFLKKETNKTHPLFYILEIIFSVIGLF
jgi:hypothetical protein